MADAEGGEGDKEVGKVGVEGVEGVRGAEGGRRGKGEGKRVRGRCPLFLSCACKFIKGISLYRSGFVNKMSKLLFFERLDPSYLSCNTFAYIYVL